MQHFSIEDILKCRKVNSKWKMFIDTNKIMLQKLIEPRLCYLCAIQNTFKMCNKVDQTKIDGKIEFLRKTVHSGNVEELQKIAFSKKEEIKLQIVLKDNLIMCKIRVKDDQKIFKKIIYLLLKLRIKYVKNYYESRLSTWKKRKCDKKLITQSDKRSKMKTVILLLLFFCSAFADSSRCKDEKNEPIWSCSKCLWYPDDCKWCQDMRGRTFQSCFL